MVCDLVLEMKIDVQRRHPAPRDLEFIVKRTHHINRYE